MMFFPFFSKACQQKALFVAAVSLMLCLFASRTEGESPGHVWGEVQTIQGDQIHDKGWQVPSQNLEAPDAKEEHFSYSPCPWLLDAASSPIHLFRVAPLSVVA